MVGVDRPDLYIIEKYLIGKNFPNAQLAQINTHIFQSCLHHCPKCKF